MVRVPLKAKVYKVSLTWIIKLCESWTPRKCFKNLLRLDSSEINVNQCNWASQMKKLNDASRFPHLWTSRNWLGLQLRKWKIVFAYNEKLKEDDFTR